MKLIDGDLLQSRLCELRDNIEYVFNNPPRRFMEKDAVMAILDTIIDNLDIMEVRWHSE